MEETGLLVRPKALEIHFEVLTFETKRIIPNILSCSKKEQDHVGLLTGDD